VAAVFQGQPIWSSASRQRGARSLLRTLPSKPAWTNFLEFNLRIPLPNAGLCAHNAGCCGFFPCARMKKVLIVWWTLTKVVVAVFLVGWFALLLRRYDHLFGIVLPAWSKVPGFIFLGVGGFFILLCGGLLGAQGFGTPGNRFFPKEFIVFGPFRYVRNPGLWERSHRCSALVSFIALRPFCYWP